MPGTGRLRRPELNERVLVRLPKSLLTALTVLARKEAAPVGRFELPRNDLIVRILSDWVKAREGNLGPGIFPKEREPGQETIAV